MQEALEDICTLPCQLVSRPTMYKNLISGWPDFIGIVDALSHSVAGIIISKGSGCVSMVFWVEWKLGISGNVVLFNNTEGTISTLDLEWMGLFLL